MLPSDPVITIEYGNAVDSDNMRYVIPHYWTAVIFYSMDNNSTSFYYKSMIYQQDSSV